MKTTLPIVVAVATCLGATALRAQEALPPQPPPKPEAPPQADPGRPGEPGPHHKDRRDARREEGRHGPEHREHREHRKEHGRPGRESAPQPFLGVITAPVPEAVSAQLGLPEGFGLLVEEVLPESPASKAGLQKHDILKLLNDQQLVEPSQLAILIRAAGKDTDVSLTILRKGQEQKLSVKVGERVAPTRKLFNRRFGMDMPGMPGMPDLGGRVEERARKMHEQAREHLERAKKTQEELRERMMDGRSKSFDDHSIPPKDILREAKPGGGAAIKRLGKNSVASVDGSKTRLFLKDSEGEIAVSSDDGNRTLVAKNAQGEVVFDGPINTPEQLEAVPKEFRNKLQMIQVHDAATNPAGGISSRDAEDEDVELDNVQ